jgi:hypothetical protein
MKIAQWSKANFFVFFFSRNLLYRLPLVRFNGVELELTVTRNRSCRKRRIQRRNARELGSRLNQTFAIEVRDIQNLLLSILRFVVGLRHWGSSWGGLGSRWGDVAGNTVRG